jgi:regulator of sigma E protease
MDEDRQNKPDELFSQAWYRRIGIALAGPIMNYLLAFVLFALVAGISGVLRPSTQPVIGDIVPGLPAAQAQLRSGDVVRQIDGATVATWDQMAQIIHERAGQTLKLNVSRPSETQGSSTDITVSITPLKDPQHGIGLIGIVPKIDKIRPGFRGSISSAAHDIQAWTMQPLTYLFQSAKKMEGPKELSGPIGIARMVTKATKEGFSYVVYLIAIISTGLGLFKLFPIPMLDGGHVFMYLIEGIMRRPLSRKALQVANTFGLSIVLTIFLYASYQDVLRWHK